MQYDGVAMTTDLELALPELPADSVRAFNAFYRRRGPLSAAVAGRRVSIEPSWIAGENVGGCLVRLDIDGRDGELRVPRALLDFLLASAESAPPLEGLSSEHAAIVLEFALREPLDALEARLGCRVSVVAVSVNCPLPEEPARPGVAQCLPLSFSLAVEGAGTARFELRLAPGQAIGLAQFLDGAAGGSAAKLDLPFAICLRLGSTTLTAGEIASLSPGDVVLADEFCQPGAAVLVVAGCLAAPASLTTDGVRLAAALAPLRGSAWEWASSRQTQASPRESAPAGSVDGVPIRLLFELDRAEFALCRFGELTPGALLPFAPRVGYALDIIAEDRRIGKGVMVQAGASKGIRIMRLANGKA